RSADVSALVTGPGTYRVGAVPASLAAEDAAAGWSLYVVYRTPTMAPRRIALLTFMSAVTSESADADVTASIAGLCVPPDPEADAAQVTLSAIDGDANIAGDTLGLARQQGQVGNNGARLTALGATADNI